MAFKHGSTAAIWFNGQVISTYANDVSVSVDVDTADTSTFASTWKTAVAGLAGAKVDIKGLYDPTFTSLPTAIQANAGVLTVLPSGTAIGDKARLIDADTTSYAETSPVGDVVGFNWSTVADGRVGYGYSLLPITTIAVSTTGASTNDAAATVTGAIAHLHVTNIVSATGTWTVLVQDSANDSSWATIGTFTGVTAIGAQRLVIAGTVRQYVRYVATVSGGTSPTMTFGIALART
jgi:hypothetical protein